METKTYVTGIEQISCRFIGAMFAFAIFVRMLPRISTRARKQLCSATLRLHEKYVKKLSVVILLGSFLQKLQIVRWYQMLFRKSVFNLSLKFQF